MWKWEGGRIGLFVTKRYKQETFSMKGRRGGQDGSNIYIYTHEETYLNFPAR